MNQLRSCAGCSGHIVTNDGRSEYVWCRRCYPKYNKPFEEWTAALGPGDRVYVQPVALPDRALSRSEWLIVGRDGDRVTLQIVGWPESRFETTVSQLGQHDLTPRRTP